MSRALWAAALAASVCAFALTRLVSPAPRHAGVPGHAAVAHAKQDPRSAPTIEPIVGVSIPALDHLRRRATARRAVPHPAAVRFVSDLLSPGSGYRQAAGSEHVRALQRRLAGLGFSPGPIDGRYGPITAQAVELLQSADGLTVDGILGAHTLAALNATSNAALVPGAGYQQAAGLGRVRVLQRRLAGLGFSPGPIDGRYGPLTTAAVKRFQSAQRLTVNGIVGTDTLSALRMNGRGPVLVSRRTNHAVPRTAPVPRSHQVPRDHPIPSDLPAPQRDIASAPATRHGQPSPAVAVILVLVGLGALGLAMISLSYRRTRTRRPRGDARGHASSPPAYESQAGAGALMTTGQALDLAVAQVYRAREIDSVPEVPVGRGVDSVSAVPVGAEVDSVPAVPVGADVDSVRAVPADHEGDLVPAIPVGREVDSVREVPAGHEVDIPRAHGGREVRDAPEVHPVPLARSVSKRRGGHRSYAASPSRLGLAALGLATITLSYARTRANGRRKRKRAEQALRVVASDLVGVVDSAAKRGGRRQ